MDNGKIGARGEVARQDFGEGRFVASILPLKELIGLGHAVLKTNIANFMNKLEIKGDWKIVKGRLKQRFGKLTDNDLRYNEGQEEELLGRIQKRLGETREEVERLLNECSKG